MAAKDLKYFMRPQEERTITAPGPASITDGDGNVIELEIKIISQEEIERINKMYEERGVASDKKGRPLINSGEVVFKTKRDTARAIRHMIAEALVYPNLKDKGLMEYYKCVDISEMALKVFKSSDEYAHVSRIVLNAIGILDDLDDDDDTVEEAKN